MAKISNQTIWENKESIKILSDYLGLIAKYVEAKKNNDINEFQSLEVKMSLMHSKVNTVFINAGTYPLVKWGNAFNQVDISIVQEIPKITSLYLGEDNVFGGRGTSHDLNILRDVVQTYVSLVGVYEHAQKHAWINTLFPLGFILRLPARIIKFFINSIFDMDVSSNNTFWRLAAPIINILVWLATILPLIDRLGYGEELDTLISVVKNFLHVV